MPSMPSIIKYKEDNSQYMHLMKEVPFQAFDEQSTAMLLVNRSSAGGKNPGGRMMWFLQTFQAYCAHGSDFG
uniref:Uncharacterized protein n=1 Tax=Caenorhabditis japonica TaxID=281687 RepID=A0A8R1E6V4_CAEJA